MSVNDSRLYIMNDIFNKVSKEFVTVDGNVRKIQKENLTPYKVTTVILIKEYCNEATKGIFYCVFYYIMKISNILYYFKENDIYSNYGKT